MGKVNYLTMTRDGDSVVLTFSVHAVPSIAREHRLRAARDLLRRAAEKASAIEEEASGNVLRFRFDGADPSTQRLVTHLGSRIAKIFAAPLTPRIVDKVLGINSRERLRWYKDGRLPTCGRAVVGDAEHVVRVPLFPIEAIERLRAEPGIIEAWRKQDAQSST